MRTPSKRVGRLPTYPMAELPAIKRRLIQQGVDVIDVGAGDADFAPPRIAVEALARAAQDPAMSRYAFQLGLPAFRESAAAYMQRRFGLQVDPFTELHPLLGSKEGIAHLAAAILDPGDYHLRPDSPCIDAGSRDAAATTDIEGSGRPCGGGVDLGAFEAGACPPPNAFRRGDVNADGASNLTDAVSILSHLFAGGLAPPCSKSADADDTGTVGITDAVYLLNFLFSGGPAPAAPSAECGPDPTLDGLTCERFAACM